MHRFTREDLAATLERAMAPYNNMSAWDRHRLDEQMRRMQREAAEERSRKALHTMAEHGWYLDPTWLGGAETYVGELFGELPEAEVDEYLCRQIEDNREQSLEGLIEQFPVRERFFRQAFAAHERGEYALAIPLMLMQADGICEELLAVQLHGRERTGEMKLVAAVQGTAVTMYLQPLLEPHPIAHNVKERLVVGSSVVVNRHTVLHGESTDYDTYQNSCRTISYLRYVGWILASAAKCRAVMNQNPTT